jgi:hypothetical protein
MKDRSQHILNAASNLLGVCFVLIAGLKLTRSNAASLGDETAWFAAILLLVSVLLAYLSLRSSDERRPYGIWADRIFIVGTLALFGSVALVALSVS